MRGRRALDPGDLVRIGRTTLVLRGGAHNAVDTSRPRTARRPRGSPRPSGACWSRSAGPAAVASPTPASNQEIADELVLSVAGVKTHLRALFDKLDVDDLPQNRKRAELARRALAIGLVGPADYE